MANIASLQDGFTYQSLYFWWKACDLFHPKTTNVIEVGYEVSEVKSFDDVAVYYDESMVDEEGHPLKADYFQIKYHVDYTGDVTCEALIDPAFINAPKISFLQKLHTAQKNLAPDGTGCRFYLMTSWPIASSDPLASLVRDEVFSVKKLFQGGPRSKMGKVRKMWREHLGLNHDDELRAILKPLRLVNKKTITDLIEILNTKLINVGLQSVAANHTAHIYDDLIRKESKRHKKFTRQKIEELTKTHNLWLGPPMQQARPIQVGVRSFLPWAENREKEVDQLLCLARYFNKRKIKASSLWNNTIFGELKEFLYQTMRSSESYHLHFDAHSSIAFATGYCLYPKSGVDVTLVQRSAIIGRSIWHGRNIPRQEEILWLDKQILCNPKGQDVALAISIAQPVLDDVEIYVRDVLPSVRRIISLTIPPAPGSSTVRDGTHARQLAEDVSRRLQARLREEKRGVLHIFAAAPVGFLFYLGQLARSFGRCVSYEYAFEDNTPGGYQASFVFPPSST